jgi:hypothetical protein
MDFMEKFSKIQGISSLIVLALINLELMVTSNLKQVPAKLSLKCELWLLLIRFQVLEKSLVMNNM